MISIPEGDWFCYDCVSKATGKCHCFVCGLAKPMGAAETAAATAVDPAHRLAQCVSCARGAHPACLRPPLNRLPKRWTCMLCTASGVSGAMEKVAVAATATSELHSLKKVRVLRLFPFFELFNIDNCSHYLIKVHILDIGKIPNVFFAKRVFRAQIRCFVAWLWCRSLHYQSNKRKCCSKE